MTINTDGAMPELPENIREGAPYDNARFEELCREHDIWGTAESAMCAVFWRTAIQQAAGCEHLRGDVGSRWCALAEKPEYPEQFPRRILDLIKEVARREDSGSYGAWQDENGEPMQDDADAALKWISGQQAAGSVPEGPTPPEWRALLKRLHAVEQFPTGTCPASRHVAMMGEYLIRGLPYPMLSEEPQHCAESMLHTVIALWEARGRQSGSSDNLVPCSQAEPPEGWLPIETAPDETPVWLVSEGGNIWIGERCWDGDGWMWGNCYLSIYQRADHTWASSDCEVDDDYQPVKWMPLPPPPARGNDAPTSQINKPAGQGMEGVDHG